MRTIKLIVLCLALSLLGAVYFTGAAQNPANTNQEAKACCGKKDGGKAGCRKHEGQPACNHKQAGDAKRECGDSCKKNHASGDAKSCCGDNCCQGDSCQAKGEAAQSEGKSCCQGCGCCGSKSAAK
jgi:hypothetical protein